MIVTAYRITKSAFAASIWSGIGARDFGGRWNSKGNTVVYAAESRALAAMEQLVHLVKPRILSGYVVASISFDSGTIERLDPAKLPRGWDDPVALPALRRYGDDWTAAGRHAVLRVPSVIIRGEYNYLINPAHTDFAHMTTSTPEPFVYDSRLA